jgi:DNA-binding transcriptional regulator YiaG
MSKAKGKKMKWTGEKIMAMRKSHRLNRTQLAELLGVSKFTIRNIEQGQIFATESMQRLLNYVEKDLSEQRDLRTEKQPA